MNGKEARMNMYAFYGGKSITATQPDIAGPLQTQGLPESGDVWKLYSACWFNGSNYVLSGRAICGIRVSVYGVKFYSVLLLRPLSGNTAPVPLDSPK